MGTGNSRTQRALMDSVSADLSVSLDPNLDRVPAGTAPVLSSATLSGHLYPGSLRQSRVSRMCTVWRSLCMWGGSRGSGACSVRFGSTARLARRVLTPVRRPQCGSTVRICDLMQ